MLTNKLEWWTEEKVDSTVTAHFIYSHLRPEEAEKLTIRVFATFTDDTYLQWILLKAKRLFLTLVDANIAGQIFRLVDEAYDDEDLPFAEDDIPPLRLPRSNGQAINHQFYRCQFRYLLRFVGEGQHIRYAGPEVIPVQTVQPTQLPLKNGPDRVTLLSSARQILVRKRIQLTEDRDEFDVLSEIAVAKAFSHVHILSVFGSYSHDDMVFPLLLPATKYNLKNLLADTPKVFANLPKHERRSYLLNWGVCLASAVEWLHSHGTSHGAIRPSRIQIDDAFQPSLGHFEGDGVLGELTAKDDLEAYQYTAPEFWKRELTLQGARTGKSSGDRLAKCLSTRQGFRLEANHRRKVANSEPENASEAGAAPERDYAFTPVSKGNTSRLQLEECSREPSMIVRSDRDLESRISTRLGPSREASRTFAGLRRRIDAGSLKSFSTSGDDNNVRTQSKILYSIPAETKTTVVQTWKSAAHDLLAADIFALAAVITELLTALCGRTFSAFAKHRASKNRQAGRGGGVADASFHANLPQVATWAQTLHKDADKKAKKAEGLIFRAVGPILQIVIQCLDRDPQKRMQAASLTKRMRSHLVDFAELKDLHCPFIPAEKSRVPDKFPEPTELLAVPQDEASIATSSDWRQPDRSHARKITKTWEEYDLEIPASTVHRQPSFTCLSSESESGAQSPGRMRKHECLNAVNKHERAFTGRSRPQGVDSFWQKQPRPRIRIPPSEDGSERTSPPSLYSRTTGTGTYTSVKEYSEPNTPVLGSATSQKGRSPILPDQLPADYKPPNRDLPPIPSVPMSTSSKSLRIPRSSTSRRKKASPPLADVDQPTHLLALAAGASGSANAGLGVGIISDVDARVTKDPTLHPNHLGLAKLPTEGMLNLSPPYLRLGHSITGSAEDTESGFGDLDFYLITEAETTTGTATGTDGARRATERA